MELELSFEDAFYQFLDGTPQEETIFMPSKSWCSLEPTGRFKPAPTDSFDIQYNHMCVDRLRKIASRFPSQLYRVDISVLSNFKNKEICFIVGHVSTADRSKRTRESKYLELTSASEELAKRQKEEELKKLEKENLKEFTLEDETGKVKVCLQPRLEHMGCLLVGVIGAKGYFNRELNRFICEEIIFPSMIPQNFVISALGNSSFYEASKSSSQYLMLTAGLRLNQDYRHLQDVICRLSKTPIVNQIIARISGLVVAGRFNHDDGFKVSKTDNFIGKIKQFNEHLEQLLNFSDVYLMPASQDCPNSNMLPQSPIDRGLLSNNNNRNERLRRCSNPEIFSYPHKTRVPITLLGTCGENVKNMMEECGFTDEIQTMHYQLSLGHIAPTAPENLKVMPSRFDKFLLDSLPNLYFTAGREFQAKPYIVGGNKDGHWCQNIVVPDFRKGVVLVNLDDLSSTLISLA